MEWLMTKSRCQAVSRRKTFPSEVRVMVLPVNKGPCTIRSRHLLFLPNLRIGGDGWQSWRFQYRNVSLFWLISVSRLCCRCSPSDWNARRKPDSTCVSIGLRGDCARREPMGSSESSDQIQGLSPHLHKACPFFGWPAKSPPSINADGTVVVVSACHSRFSGFLTWIDNSTWRIFLFPVNVCFNRFFGPKGQRFK